MMVQRKAPYGSWKSPITPDLVVTDAVKLKEIVTDGGDLYWLEMRPSEGGRYVIVHADATGNHVDVTPEAFNVRTLVHEYGGAPFTVHRGNLYFSNYKDQRIFKHVEGEQPVAITPDNSMRYTQFSADEPRNRLICVLEDHSASAREAVNAIAAIDLDTGASEVLVSGNDFYAFPCLSPNGKQLAWITWNHPDMPWDNTELWVADVTEEGSLMNSRKVAGGDEESIFQPQWSPDGTLYFISDRTSGWWNLYRWRNEKIEHVIDKQAEFGLPLWVFGMSTYDFESDNKLICTYFQNGSWYLGMLEISSGAFQTFDLPFTHIEQVGAASGQAIFIAGSPILPKSVVRLDLKSGSFEILRKSTDLTVESTYFSRPETLEFPTENGLTAHAYFYPPQNRDFEGPEDELPPLIVKSHGGPTGSTSTDLDLRIQFWTSRGFAILDVDYGGSTGYGREYRNRLQGKWGIVDVDDCINAAKYLIQKNAVDPERTAIAGGSAGGYTTLSALTFRDFFKAGSSYYGISDLEALATDTHKFESRYLDSMIGPYPDRKDIYEARSPIHHTDKLSCPVILMQGLEDKIVPPSQAERMVEALRKKGLPVAYVTFEGEQHGFRKAGNIKRSLEAELYFYSQIFGFDLADNIEPIHIENL